MTFFDRWWMLRLGAIVFVLGRGPLLAVRLAVTLGLTADPNPNPVGPVILEFLTFYPSIVMMLVGVAIGTVERPGMTPESWLRGPVPGILGLLRLHLRTSRFLCSHSPARSARWRCHRSVLSACLGAWPRAGRKVQIVKERSVCVVSCQRSPEPVFLKWKGIEATPDGDFFVRSGPGTVKLPPESAQEYIRARFAARSG